MLEKSGVGRAREIILGKRLWLAALALFAVNAFGQQSYVGSYSVFAGFTYLESPSINLAERGFHTQIGINPRTWLGIGFDYSISTGHTSITQSELIPSLQQQLNAELAPLIAAGFIPANFMLTIPIDSTSQTFALGPQLEYRHWRWVTLFIRPSIGAIHEAATVHANGPIEQMILARLAPSGTKTDWTGFYGFGGGKDLILGDRLSIRVQADFVHDHLFSDLLPGRNTVRFSIGPTFHFGRNVAK